MEVHCTDGWHIQPNHTLHFSNQPEDPLPEPIVNTLTLRKEWQNLSKIDTPNWLCVGSTGYIEYTRLPRLYELKEGYFMDPFERLVVIYNGALIFQRYPDREIWVGDYINSHNQCFACSYPYFIEDSFKKPEPNRSNQWHYPKDPTVTFPQLAQYFSIDDAGDFHSTKELDTLPSKFITKLPDGRLVERTSHYLLYQRWADRYVMLLANV
jgi:hypothetical protein